LFQIHRTLCYIWVMLVLSILVAVLPVIAACSFIYYKDKYEKESAFLLFKCFAWGMFSTIPAIIFEYYGSFLSNSTHISQTLLFAFFVIGFAEEIVKFLFLRYYIFKDPEFNEPMDGIVYAVFIGMGFAFVENIGYAISFGLNNTIVRAFTAVPAHVAFGVMMGYFFGLAKLSFIVAWLLHGFYDFLILSSNNDFLAAYVFPLIIISLVYSYKMIEENNALSPFKKEKESL
jgi:protease PrsW